METQNINKAEVPPKTETQVQDIFINGKSTNEYTDRDWDVYRNNRIGFIFQSYNLLPHQTVLGNTELALTISDISKAEKNERDKNALDRVALQNKYNKHLNQLHLSGGQYQIVEIACALIINLEILFGYNIYHLLF